MNDYKKLTPPEKKAFRRYLLKTFKKHNIRRLNSKTVPSNKVIVLIEEFKNTFNKDPFICFHEKLITQVSSKQGYVYVIGNLLQKVCKIGFSENPKKRIKSIQTGCPFVLNTLLLFEADKYTETRLHHKYAKYRISGEWFSIEGELKESIEKHMKIQPKHV